jgi:hypothetical protein
MIADVIQANAPGMSSTAVVDAAPQLTAAAMCHFIWPDGSLGTILGSPRKRSTLPCDEWRNQNGGRMARPSRVQITNGQVTNTLNSTAAGGSWPTTLTQAQLKLYRMVTTS